MGIEGVIGHREVVAAAEEPLISVGVHDVEARFAELHVDVGVAERIVADFHIALIRESGQSGLEARSIVFGIVVAVYAELEAQCCYFAEEVEIAINRYFGKRENGVVRCLLICDTIIPVQYAELEVLSSTCFRGNSFF